MSFQRIPVTKSQLSGAEWVRACLEASDAKDPPDEAYKVPWRATWGDDGCTLHVTNFGDEVLLMVRVFAVSEQALSTLPSRVLPGEVVTAKFPSSWQGDAAFVRWLRPGGAEYVWPAVR